MTVVLTLGTFDLPHSGHFNFLRRASMLGDLFVAINTDEFVKEYKGEKPIMSLNERTTIIENCQWVRGVFINEGCGKRVINKIKPDCIVIGSDWMKKDYLKQIGFEEEPITIFDPALNGNRDVPVIYVPYTTGVSSTEIKRRLK